MKQAPENATAFLKTFLAILLVLACAWSAWDLAFSALGRGITHRVIETQASGDQGLVGKRVSEIASSHTVFNSLGLRRNFEIPPKAAGERRILVLGDSTAFGNGLNQGQDWPTVLETQLRQSGVKATVMNAAYPGDDMRDTWRACQWFLGQIQVDLVLLHSGWSHVFCKPLRPGPHNGPNAVFPKVVPAWPAKLDGFPGWDRIDLPKKQNIQTFTAPAPLVALARTSSLADAWNGDFLPRLDAAIQALSLPSPLESPVAPEQTLTPIETLALYSCFIARDVSNAQCPLVIIRPFSAFRIPGLPESTYWEEYKQDAFGFHLSDYPKMMDAISNMDLVFDAIHGKGFADLADPTPRFLGELYPIRMARMRELLHDHNHFSAEASVILAGELKRHLMSRGYLEVSTAAPWVHPGEPVFTNKPPAATASSPPSFRIAATILVGVLLLLLFCAAGLGMLRLFGGRLEPTVWAGTAIVLGLGAVVAGTIFLFQWMNSLLAVSITVFSCIVPVAIWGLWRRTGAPPGVTSHSPWPFKLRLILVAFTLFGLAAFSTHLMSHQDQPGTAMASQRMATWTTALCRLDGSAGNPMRLQEIYTECSTRDPASLDFLKIVIPQPVFHEPLAPLFPAALKRIFGLDSDLVLWLFWSLTATALALPGFWTALAHGVPPLRRLAGVVNGSGAFLVALFLGSPATQQAGIFMSLLVLSVMLSKEIAAPGALLLLACSSAVLLLTPTPTILVLTVGLLVFWALSRREAPLWIWPVLALSLALLGKTLFARYPGASGLLGKLAADRELFPVTLGQPLLLIAWAVSGTASFLALQVSNLTARVKLASVLMILSAALSCYLLPEGLRPIALVPMVAAWPFWRRTSV